VFQPPQHRTHVQTLYDNPLQSTPYAGVSHRETCSTMSMLVPILPFVLPLSWEPPQLRA